MEHVYEHLSRRLSLIYPSNVPFYLSRKSCFVLLASQERFEITFKANSKLQSVPRYQGFPLLAVVMITKHDWFNLCDLSDQIE